MPKKYDFYDSLNMPDIKESAVFRIFEGDKLVKWSNDLRSILYVLRGEGDTLECKSLVHFKHKFDEMGGETKAVIFRGVPVIKEKYTDILELVEDLTQWGVILKFLFEKCTIAPNQGVGTILAKAGIIGLLAGIHIYKIDRLPL